MLTLVLLATTFFIFNPSLLKAKAAFAVWDGTYRTTSPTHTDQLMGTYKSAGFVSKNDTTKVIEISDPKALILFGNMISKEGWCREWTVKLTNDIDLNGYAGSNTKWPGFGRYITDRCFEGTFDGQGHTIKNMVTEANYGNGTDNLGFFGALKGGTITNITFANCTVGPSSLSREAHGFVAG